MWTDENRARSNRDHLRYPSDLTDDEWALVEPFIPPPKPGGGKRKQDMRAVMNGVMYIVGIAAAKAGAREVIAAEIDRYALAALGLNSAVNGVEITAIGHLVADEYRTMEGHGGDRHRDGAALGAPRRRRAAREVHLREEPAAE